MITNILILLAIVGATLLFAWPKVAHSAYWRAMVTPLASIIGSGFLVIGPILLDGFGSYAVLAMAGLCLTAFAFGHAIRYNIALIDDGATESILIRRLELTSDWALAFAYIISVAYYLNLFGAFAVSLTPIDSANSARLVTTAIFVVIIGIGLKQGFDALERLEQFAVSLKLAIIAGLLASLIWSAGVSSTTGEAPFQPAPLSPWGSLTLLFGLIVTVQGFETSRYLGDNHSADLRRQTMRSAQWLATAIYIVYIACLSLVFAGDDIPLSETAIIGLMEQVSPILPTLLVVAALASQFSAGIADTGGGGGLFHELTRGRLSVRHSYILIGIVGIILTWVASVFDIISYASRAFAVYYGLQAGVAAMRARQNGELHRFALYLCLGALGLLIAVFGTAVAA